MNRAIALAPQPAPLPLEHGIIIDHFAGGGGASEGIRLALGRCPDAAVNHDPMENLRASGDSGFWSWDLDDEYTAARTALLAPVATPDPVATSPAMALEGEGG